MLALYSLLLKLDLSIYIIIVLFGLFISLSMVLVHRRHQLNQRRSDSMHLIGMEKPPATGAATREN